MVETPAAGMKADMACYEKYGGCEESPMLKMSERLGVDG